LIKIRVKRIAARLYIQNLVADSLFKGIFITSIIPKLSGINEISVSILKSIIGGNKFVKERIKNMSVANNPEIIISLKPKLRPLVAIHVILPADLSPSISGISTLQVNNNCKNTSGTTKITKEISIVPIKTKYPKPGNSNPIAVFPNSPSPLYDNLTGGAA
jgi:hypothetical protein